MIGLSEYGIEHLVPRYRLIEIAHSVRENNGVLLEPWHLFRSEVGERVPYDYENKRHLREESKGMGIWGQVNPGSET